MPMERMPPRNLIDLADLQPGEIERLLDRAAAFRSETPKRTALRDVAVVNMFFEASTRTLTSFVIAEARLGADVVTLPPQSSSMTKGETIADTVQTLYAMGVRIIVARHEESGFPYRLAESFEGSVVNAGDGTHAHPTQALLDILTLRDEFGSIDRLTVAIVGDVLHSRVARSNIAGLQSLGARIVLVGPPTLVPDSFARLGVDIERDLDRALPHVDAVMLLRVQRERIASALIPSVGEYSAAYRMDKHRLRKLRPDAVVMHPGPYNRGTELTDEVIAWPNFRYANQVGNGVPVRMAVLEHVLAPASASA